MRKHSVATYHTALTAIILIIITFSFFFAESRHLQPQKDAQNATAQAAGQITWPQFDGDPQKSGTNTNDPVITKANVATFKQLWKVSVSSDGSPVYLSGVTTAQGVKNLVFVTTQQGSLIAFDEATGAQIWSKTTSGSGGTTTSSPVIDPSHQFVFSYGKDGKVHKYAVGNGAEDTSNGWPLTATLMPDVEKESSALAISNSYLYVTTSAYPGDAGTYVGHIVGKNLSTGTVSVFNTLCADNNQLLNGNCSSSQSGVWARPGAVVDPSTGNIFISSGNGPYSPPNNLGDSVIELSPDLSHVIDTYTPTNFQTLDDQDEDLGSSVVGIIPGLEIGIQGGKDNKIRVLNLKNLSGQGSPYHTGGELQSISIDCNIFSHPISWNDGTATWVFITDMCNNLYAYKVNGNQLQQGYKKSGAGGSSPLMVSGMLFIQSAGAVRAIDPTTGNTLWTGQVGSQHWQSPAVINGHIFVLDNDGNLTAFGIANAPASGNTTPAPSSVVPTLFCLGSCAGSPTPTSQPATSTSPNPSGNMQLSPIVSESPCIVIQSVTAKTANKKKSKHKESKKSKENNGSSEGLANELLQLLIKLIEFLLSQLGGGSTPPGGISPSPSTTPTTPCPSATPNSTISVSPIVSQ